MSNFATRSSVLETQPAHFHQNAVQPVPDACLGSLRSVIESQIIPRLLEAHPQTHAGNAPRHTVAYAPDDAEIAAFANLCTQGQADEVMLFIEKLLLDNVNNDSLFLNLIAPAARYLGLQWEQEQADFTQVTMGLLRMHQITHRIGYEYQSGPQKAGPAKRIMLACAPGSQHILGLAMVSEFFRKDGWQVVVEIATTATELHRAVKNEWFDLIGLSVALTDQLSTLPVLIANLKQNSRNPKTPVLLGGSAFAGDVPNARSLGADGISTDALDGLQLAALLVQPEPQPG